MGKENDRWKMSENLSWNAIVSYENETSKTYLNDIMHKSCFTSSKLMKEKIQIQIHSSKYN